MKIVIIALFLFSLSSFAFCQEQDKDFERKNYYELTGRANFFEVNNRYEIFKDTILFSNSGFLIYAEWDEVSIEDKIYVVVTYPKFKNGTQSSREGSPITGFLVGNPVRHPIAGVNSKILCIPKDEFEKIEKKPLYSVNWKKIRNYQISAGQLTLPFKLRPKQGNTNFQMTTDVTVGAYGGVRKRISKYSPTYLTIPVVLGLSFINVNENTTTITGNSDFKSGITPGWTWATGIVIQTNRLSLGCVIGRDYASGYGNDWIYHNKTWYSFGIGYSFLK